MSAPGSSIRHFVPRLFGLCLCGLLQPNVALADQTAPTAITCVEKLAAGAAKPQMKETFPGEAVAGYEAKLEIAVTHGLGETVLPNGFKVLPGSETEKALREAGFSVAESNGGSPPTIERKTEAEQGITLVTIPMVVLPTKSGKQSLTVPELPITIQRAGGESSTVCSQMHLIVVSDPTAGEEEPVPRPNPSARPQIEDWPLMRWILLAVVLGLLVFGITSYWVRRQLLSPVPSRRAPGRLPWEIAIDEFNELATSPLMQSEQQRAELFDRMSDILRNYLGSRYGFGELGFEGIDTTTDEMLALLRRVQPQVTCLNDVKGFLAECDLVKFARALPTEVACRDALERAKAIVQKTVPGPEPSRAERLAESPPLQDAPKTQLAPPAEPQAQPQAEPQAQPQQTEPPQQAERPTAGPTEPDSTAPTQPDEGATP